MIFVDTGALIARHLRRDQHHQRAVAAWQSLQQDRTPCITTNFVLNEAITYFVRRTNSRFAAEVAVALYSSPGLQIIRPSQVQELTAIDLLKKYADQRVGFTDCICISFALMQDLGIHRAFSFDRHFDLPGFTRFPL